MKRDPMIRAPLPFGNREASFIFGVSLIRIIFSPPLLQSDAGVNPAVYDVHEKIYKDDKGGQIQDNSFKQGKITAADGLKKQASQSGKIEGLLDYQASAQNIRSNNGQHGEHRDQCIRKNVTDHDIFIGKAVALRGAYVFLLLLNEYGRPQELYGHSYFGQGNRECGNEKTADKPEEIRLIRHKIPGNKKMKSKNGGRDANA